MVAGLRNSFSETARGAQLMPRKSAAKPKLTDAERHKRFVAMAREVGASDKAEDFERAFSTVARPKAKAKSARKD
jgi:hypothetical protein